MGKNHREKTVTVKVGLILNAQEILAVDQLLESGLFGLTRSAVIRRLMDERLVELYSSTHKLRQVKAR